MGDSNRLTVGIMIGDANSAHSIKTLQGIRQAAKETGVNTVTFLGVHTEYMFRDFYGGETSYDYQVMTVFDYADIAKIDALVISYGELGIYLQDEERERFFDKIKNIPKVILEERMTDDKTRYLIPGNYDGMRALLEHLVVDHGYRNFAELRGPVGNTDADERHRAFLDTMKEYGIEVTEDMVQIGDYTVTVEQEVEYLFDHNPHMEALVCANDAMATCAYRVCQRRRREILRMSEESKEWLKRSPLRYKIGVDIESGEGVAIVGYDDSEAAAIMDPPMTTASQNEFSNGYRALYNVLDLLKTGRGENYEQKSELVRRNSCGCRDAEQKQFAAIGPHERQHPEIYVIKLAERMKNVILISDVNEGIGEQVYDLLYDVLYADVVTFLGLVKEQLTPKQVIEQMRNLLTGPYAEYISPTALASVFSDFLSNMIRQTESHSNEVLLTEIMVEGMKYLQNFVYNSAKTASNQFENDSWFMSMIARDMAGHVDSEKEMFLNAMQKMHNLSVGNAYIFTLKEPLVCTSMDEWKCPKELYLSAYTTTAGKTYAYNSDERPVMTGENGFSQYVNHEDGSAFHIILTPLYADRVQYGVMAFEATPREVLTMFNASVQIGTALKYYDLSRAQQRAQRNLETMIREVEEKNSMLRFISEYDALTGFLNRRGFIERAMELKNENIGSTVAILFCDLDHLKEINDKFGHIEGDYALKSIAEIVRKAIGEKAIFSRIGGDEFVIVCLVDDVRSGESCAQAIQEQTRIFNAISDKPFYVEASIGYKEFVCDREISIPSMLDEADIELYTSKKNRRQSVAK